MSDREVDTACQLSSELLNVAVVDLNTLGNCVFFGSHTNIIPFSSTHGGIELATSL
jgi:hypothetical protein